MSRSSGPLRHPDCPMINCYGDRTDDLIAVNDPGGRVTDVCEGCLDAGWDNLLEVVDR